MKNIIVVIFIFIAVMGIALASEMVTKQVNDGQSPFYAVMVEASELKYSWSKAEVEEMQGRYIEEQQKTESIIYELTHQLRHFEGTEEEKAQLEHYVNDLKAGKVSINVDHVIAERITASINKWSVHFGVEAELIRAVMRQESNFNPTVVSKSGAQGLMQIMPDTAKWLKLNNPWDIDENIRAGTQYLKDQLNTFNGDYRLALAAYNAGPGAVKKAGNKIPNYRETQAYVPAVLKFYNAYKGV